MCHAFHSRPVAAIAALILGLLTGAAPVPPQPTPRLAPVDPTGATFRLYEGLTLLVNNPEGVAFKFTVDVRDLNLIEPGPREVLFKVYDPQGKALVREVIPDDGVVTRVSQGPTGGWDHEAWYYLHQYNHGTAPMLRWSALAAADRLAATPVRAYERQIPAGAKGVYRIILVGAKDHVVTVKLDPALGWGVGGNPFFLHPTGDFLKKRFVYVPKGTTGINIALVEYDPPRTRKLTLRDETGKILAEATAPSGIGFAEAKPEKPANEAVAPPAKGAAPSRAGSAEAKPEKPGAWDEKVFSVELSDGPNACLVQFSLMSPRLEGMIQPGPSGTPAFYTADEKTARALQGGAIYHDGQVFWQPLQVRLYDWLKTLKPEDLEPKGADGKPAKRIDIQNPGGAVSFALDLAPNRNAAFISLNGVHARAPLADTIMFSYAEHHNRQALNLAISSLATGLRTLGVNDHAVTTQWKGMANLAYVFGTYAWHWWRPAWRLLQEKDTPPEVKEIVREQILNAGDRLAFCSNWERVNGNAFSTIVCGLRYVAAATGDDLSKELFQTFYDRFTTGGWGERVGLGASGLVQEEFAYDNHYGSYPIATWTAVAEDFKDPLFIKVRDGMLNTFSFILNDEVNACPFSSRTFHNPNCSFPKEGPLAWKGLPGPDLTESVNGANEFFAARRKGYYIVSYHGRMTPKWQGEGFMGQVGWSGGVICQVGVPGKGTVLASTLDGPGYGKDRDPSQWRTFHIHALVGQTADGKPLVTADGEHLNARLEGNTVTSSGEVRNSSVHATRAYTYNPDHIVAEVKLRITDDDASFNFWFKNPFRGQIAEAWEMIPFLPNKRGKQKDAEPTSVKVLDAAGKELGNLTDTLIEGQTVVIDRGGFGVRIELEKPTKVKRGAGNTVMIQVVPESPLGPRYEAAAPGKRSGSETVAKPNANDIALRYKITPFGG